MEILNKDNQQAPHQALDKQRSSELQIPQIKMVDNSVDSPCLNSPFPYTSHLRNEFMKTRNINLSLENTNPFVDSPNFPFTSLDMGIDSNTHSHLEDYMEEDKVSEQVMETPLGALYSQVKENRNLGIKQLIDCKTKPNFGIASPKRGRKYLSENQSIEGDDEGQIKITDILKVRKGSSLPKHK